MAVEELVERACELGVARERRLVGTGHYVEVGHCPPRRLPRVHRRDAMALAAQALKQMAGNSPAACKAQSVEVARLKRVADAAIDAAPKRACKLQVASVPICRVKSVLAALRLRKAESAIMPSDKAVVNALLHP